MDTSGITASPVTTQSGTPTLAHCTVCSPASRSCWAQKPRPVHAGTCSPSGATTSPPPPIGFRRRPAPKLHQSPRRSEPSKPRARALRRNHCRADVGGGPSEAARREEFPRSCRRRLRGLPPQVTASPSGGSGPDPTSGARAYRPCSSWPRGRDFQFPLPSLSNPILTVRRRESRGKACHLSAGHPVGVGEGSLLWRLL